MNARGFMVRLQTIFLLSLFASFLLAAPVSAQDGSPDGALAPEAAQILADVNQARIDNGLPALTLNPALTLASQAHVDDVIANGNWGHYGSDGSNVQMRTARAGYGSSWVSENWVAVSSTDQAIVWWMNDWIHRVNILAAHWDEIGVGAGIAPNGYWILVTDFGNSTGSAPQYVSSPTNFSANDTSAVEIVPPGGMDYTIVPGDTLLGIAIRHGLDWQDIAIANNLGEDDLLQIGDTLRLPSIGGIGGPSSEEAAEINVVAGKQRYTIAAGDTLYTIALRYDIAWQEIAAVNGLSEFDLLQLGQELALPASLDTAEEAPDDAEAAAKVANEEVPQDATSAADTSEVAEPSERFTSDHLRSDPQPEAGVAVAEPAEYRVRAGDTLLSIALRLDVSVDDLLAASGITENDYLQIGQVLAIPGPGSEETVAPSIDGEMSATSAAAEPYTIRAGDTIFAIGLRLGVDWQEILAANDLDEQSILQPGQTLVIP